jgi:diguanylate cyclase (GGDEF)-like protein
MEVARKAVRTAEAKQAEVVEMSTELTLLRRQLSHQLLHDPLTGLPNRQFFTTRLEEVLNSGHRTTLYRIELNGFAVLDDGIGSPRTDVLLIAIATRLRAAMADEGAMVARFDRASFTVLQECAPSSAGPAEIVGRLTAALAETTYVADAGLAVTANIGVVESPPHGMDPVELLQAAGLALRLAKEQGPGQWRLLCPDEDTDRRLLRFAAVMPGALETGRLSVGYRQVVALADERPVSVDAYPCWQEAGLEGQECVALAERIGLSPAVGEWLLRTAGAHVTTGQLSVRLSPNQAAAPNLVDTVLDVLPPNRLRLAMPAKEVFDGRPQTVDNLTTLAKAGVRVAVHDFTGNPSDLVRLADFPLYAVTLARRLVAQARSRGPLVTRAVANTVALVHEASATVTVDGIRTTQEAAWWHHVGADLATGPLWE